MASRLELHILLKEVLGSNNVYYQPPSTITMAYPAIVYSRDTISSKYANDNVYTSEIAYSIMVIDKNPDSLIVGKISALPTSKFNSNYTADNLNHDAFTIRF